jgi:hypothetical protein
MNIYAAKGARVVFSNPTAGYPADQKHAREYLEVGKIYTVEQTIVDDWRTTVILQEVPDTGFNSVLFSDE